MLPSLYSEYRRHKDVTDPEELSRLFRTGEESIALLRSNLDQTDYLITYCQLGKKESDELDSVTKQLGITLSFYHIYSQALLRFVLPLSKNERHLISYWIKPLYPNPLSLKRLTTP